jgi:hypothetical protein
MCQRYEIRAHAAAAVAEGSCGNSAARQVPRFVRRKEIFIRTILRLLSAGQANSSPKMGGRFTATQATCNPADLGVAVVGWLQSVGAFDPGSGFLIGVRRGEGGGDRLGRGVRLRLSEIRRRP